MKDCPRGRELWFCLPRRHSDLAGRACTEQRGISLLFWSLGRHSRVLGRPTLELLMSSFSPHSHGPSSAFTWTERKREEIYISSSSYKETGPVRLEPHPDGLIFFKIKTIYWHRVDLQCCVSFCRTAKKSVISSVQSLSRVRRFVTPHTAACQASLSITNSRSWLKLMSVESVMPSNQLILCHHLLLLPSIFPSIRVFFSESVLHIYPLFYRMFPQSRSLQSNEKRMSLNCNHLLKSPITKCPLGVRTSAHELMERGPPANP